MKRVTAIQLVERGKRLKKWFAASIAVGITLAMLVMAVD